MARRAINVRDALYLELMNQRYGERLARVPEAAWPEAARAHGRPPAEVWRSRDFLVLVYAAPAGCTRLSVLRTRLDGDRYADGITWDDLQRLKAEVGRGDAWAVEVYPPDAEVVNVQNMRHVFILLEPPPYGWRG